MLQCRPSGSDVHLLGLRPLTKPHAAKCGRGDSFTAHVPEAMDGKPLRLLSGEAKEYYFASRRHHSQAEVPVPEAPQVLDCQEADMYANSCCKTERSVGECFPRAKHLQYVRHVYGDRGNMGSVAWKRSLLSRSNACSAGECLPTRIPLAGMFSKPFGHSAVVADPALPTDSRLWLPVCLAPCVTRSAQHLLPCMITWSSIWGLNCSDKLGLVALEFASWTSGQPKPALKVGRP